MSHKYVIRQYKVRDERYLVGLLITSNAIDGATGKVIWQHHLGANIAMRGLSIYQDKIYLASGNRVKALDARNFPVSYSIGNKQYVAVTTGTGGGSPWLVPNTITPEINPPQTGFALYVFSLPDKK